MTQFTQAYALRIGVDEHSMIAWSLPAVAKNLDARQAILTHAALAARADRH